MGIKIKYLDLNCAYSKSVEDYKFYARRNDDEKGEKAIAGIMFMVRVCRMIESAYEFGEIGSISIEGNDRSTIYSANVTQGTGGDIMIYVDEGGLRIKDLDGIVNRVWWNDIDGIGVDVILGVSEDVKLPRSGGHACVEREDMERILKNMNTKAWEEIVNYVDENKLMW